MARLEADRRRRHRRAQALPHLRGGEHAGVRAQRGHETGIRQAHADTEPGVADGPEGEEHGGGERDWQRQDSCFLVAGDDSHQCPGEFFFIMRDER